VLKFQLKLLLELLPGEGESGIGFFSHRNGLINAKYPRYFIVIRNSQIELALGRVMLPGMALCYKKQMLLGLNLVIHSLERRQFVAK